MSKFGEPWYAHGPYSAEEAAQIGGVSPEIVDNEQEYVAEFYSEYSRDRAISCVNACAGMDDPAAEIARLRAYAVEAAESEATDHFESIWLRNLEMFVSRAARRGDGDAKHLMALMPEHLRRGRILRDDSTRKHGETP